jgi:transmembrane sensor
MAQSVRPYGQWSYDELAQLRLQGLEYLNHLTSGQATEDDLAAVLQWRSRSHAHEEAFQSALRLRRLVRGYYAGLPADVAADS